jgi:chaperone BCS1
LLQQTEEGIWKKSKDFDITIKSSRRKNAVAPTEEELGFKASADLVPKWTNPHLFRWNGYWVDVVRGGDTVSTNQWNGTTQTQTLKLS